MNYVKFRSRLEIFSWLIGILLFLDNNYVILATYWDGNFYFKVKGVEFFIYFSSFSLVLVLIGFWIYINRKAKGISEMFGDLVFLELEKLSKHSFSKYDRYEKFMLFLIFFSFIFYFFILALIHRFLKLSFELKFIINDIWSLFLPTGVFLIFMIRERNMFFKSLDFLKDFAREKECTSLFDEISFREFIRLFPDFVILVFMTIFFIGCGVMIFFSPNFFKDKFFLALLVFPIFFEWFLAFYFLLSMFKMYGFLFKIIEKIYEEC